MKSKSGGWWFRVPVLLKTCKETVTVPSDEYIPCLESPLDLSTETLVEGLICLNFLTLTRNECRFNKKAWTDFGTNYELGNLLEIDACNLLKSQGGSRQQYVKFGVIDENLNASKCVAKAKADPNFRIPSQLGSPIMITSPCKEESGNVRPGNSFELAAICSHISMTSLD
jgi:hypothetical protein